MSREAWGDDGYDDSFTSDRVDEIVAEAKEPLEAEISKLRLSLRVCLAFMESDIASGQITAYETRQRVMREARELVPEVK